MEELLQQLVNSHNSPHDWEKFNIVVSLLNLIMTACIAIVLHGYSKAQKRKDELKEYLAINITPLVNTILDKIIETEHSLIKLKQYHKYFFLNLINLRKALINGQIIFPKKKSTFDKIHNILFDFTIYFELSNDFIDYSSDKKERIYTALDSVLRAIYAIVLTDDTRSLNLLNIYESQKTGINNIVRAPFISSHYINHSLF